MKLFTSSKLPINGARVEEIAERAHKFTDGHALWISLMLAQAKRGLREVEEFLAKIEKKQITAPSESSFLSERILREIWDSLNGKQKILLRTLAEAVTSETEEEISKIVGSELNYNQFSKSLRTLKDLHLIVVKGEESYLELHPLVKEFIKTNFPSHEQKKYISLFISYYDRVIVLLKPRLNQILSLSEFKSWSNKIELQINNKEYNDAIALLLEIHDSIIRSGYIEEFVRLSCLLLGGLQWHKRSTSQIKNLPRFTNESITSIIDYGDYNSATEYLEKYKSTIAGKNSEYILYLSLYTHLHWYNEKISDSIKYGEEAQHLVLSSGDNDIWSAKHRLHLAYRDSKTPKNLDLSLSFFLSGYELDEIVSPNKFNVEIPYTLYGNVGRCLQYLEKTEDALNCYAKSAELMLKDNGADEELNRGYAFSWIADALKNSGNDDHLYFLLYAHQSWKKVAPPLANRIEETINSLPKTPTITSIQSTSSWGIERYCIDWCKKRISY
ncbi:tetratricopeptide (TPR) repeat protein [Pseudomonas sp. BIGb0408]|nr:tetratricopeptide (TPR) repeat protein [Pseudomonas sp. BIGb0408]